MGASAVEQTLSAGRSPLWMVSQAPQLSALVEQLQRYRAEFDETRLQELQFSRRQLKEARAEFSEMIRRGERHLHLLCGLLANTLMRGFHLHASIIGEVEQTHERFTLALAVSREDLFATTDLDLGNRLLARLRFADGDQLRRAQLVSNVVEYEAREPGGHGVFRVLSRIKAEEEIWNKVVDELFDLDGLVLRDKQLRKMSRFVKDVFGVKIVVAGEDDVYKVQSTLAMHRWSKSELASFRLPHDPHHDRLEFVEVKDYLARKSRKHSGWSAMKSVVRWAEKTFEIQVQPLQNFLHERERLTKESHAGFKATRERVRDEVAERVPLFGFYRNLLQWLFLDDSAPVPSHPGLSVTLVD